MAFRPLKGEGGGGGGEIALLQVARAVTYHIGNLPQVPAVPRCIISTSSPSQATLGIRPTTP